MGATDELFETLTELDQWVTHTCPGAGCATCGGEIDDETRRVMKIARDELARRARAREVYEPIGEA